MTPPSCMARRGKRCGLREASDRTGAGLLPGPTVVEKQIQKFYGLSLVGRLESVREQFYAITLERDLKHPAISMVMKHARDKIFN